MAYAYTIDAAVPADTDLVSEGAEAIRDFKNAVLERILTIISAGGINTDPWVITPRSNLTPGTNNTYDLGVTGTRWRHGWLSGTLAVAGLVTLAAGLTISAGTLTAQTLTTTTITASGLVTANAGLTVTAGTSALQAITGTSLTVSGTSALGSATNPIRINRVSDSTTRGLITWNGVETLAGHLGLSGVSDTLIYNAPTAGGHSFRVNNSVYVGIDATGIQVTGTGAFAAGLSLSAATPPTHGIQFGTAAPGSLANGQLWFDATDFKAHQAGTTKTVVLS